jgi:hypothetical protein
MWINQNLIMYKRKPHSKLTVTIGGKKIVDDTIKGPESSVVTKYSVWEKINLD